MEQSEFDKIMREKLQGKTDLHKHEMETVKPFVWASIQQNKNAGVLKWYHPAAAVILLLIGFGVVFYNFQFNHQRELNQISEKLDGLEKKFASQQILLESKDEELTSLKTDLTSVHRQLSEVKIEDALPVKEKIIYQRDTIVIRQVEYVVNAPPEDSRKAEQSKKVYEDNSIEMAKRKTDDVIFLSRRDQAANRDDETIEIRFGSFSKQD